MYARFMFFFYFLNWAVWLICLFSPEYVLVKIPFALLGLGLLLVCLMHSSQGCIFFYISHKLMVSGASFCSCVSGFQCLALQAWMVITVWLSLMLVTPHWCHPSFGVHEGAPSQTEILCMRWTCGCLIGIICVNNLVPLKKVLFL